MTSIDHQERITKMTKRSRLVCWLLIGVAVIVAAAGTLWWRAIPDPKPRPNSASQENADPNVVTMSAEAQRNIDLKVEPARVRAVLEYVKATGTIGPNDTRVVPMRPLARGRIERVLVRLGDSVRKGQALLVYDNIELGELLGQYMAGLAALEKAKADAEVARRAVERASTLVELGAVARADLERRNAEAASATAAINTQRAELTRIEEKFHRFGLTDAEIRQFEQSGSDHRDISRTTLSAPFDGVVTNYNVSQGEVVDTNSQLLTITDLSVVWIQADIYEKDLALVRPGFSVPVVVDSYPGETFSCKTTYVSDFLDSKTRTAKMRCELPNPDRRLKLDMFVTLTIPSPSGRQAVMAPSTSIQHINDLPVVFVRRDATTFLKREVELGVVSEDATEIRSGLKAGDELVTVGSFQLKSLLLRAEIGGEE